MEPQWIISRQYHRKQIAVIVIGGLLCCLATFSVVTTEMLPVGLLNPIRDSLVSEGNIWIVIPPLLPPFFTYYC